LDTLGQDRDFTKTERRFILETIAKFRDLWEKEQNGNLTRDRDDRLLLVKPDGGEDAGSQQAEEPDTADVYAEIEKQIDEHFLQFEELDEEKKEFVAKELRLQKTGK
jgi:hypothetical protein